MQIRMKATQKELLHLKNRIAKANAHKQLNYSKIGIISGVHASQVSRICRGEFKTLSHNVVQVCKALGLKVSVVQEGSPPDAEWSKIQASARRLWEKSDKNADQISKLLEAIGDLGCSKRPA